jgi:hypothetical protein
LPVETPHQYIRSAADSCLRARARSASISRLGCERGTSTGQAVDSGDSSVDQRLVEELGSGPDPEEAREQEFRQQLFRVAAAQVRGSFAPTTWEAFWRTAVEGKSGRRCANATATFAASPSPQ